MVTLTVPDDIGMAFLRLCHEEGEGKTADEVAEAWIRHAVHEAPRRGTIMPEAAKPHPAKVTELKR